MHTTTIPLPRKTLLFALTAGLSTAAFAAPPTDVVEVTSTRAWVTTEANAKEIINMTQDDCSESIGASSFAEMPLESLCEVRVEVPNDNGEELLTSAEAYSYAGAEGWSFQDEDGTGFAVWSMLNSGVFTGQETATSSYNSSIQLVEFTVHERAKVQVEACSATTEASNGMVTITNVATDENVFYYGTTAQQAECLMWELELPAGQYTMWADVQSTLSNAEDEDLAANMAAGIIARALTPEERADINRDGVVDGGDLLKILAYWGSDIDMVDLNQDGVVNGADITVLFAYWT